MANFHAMEGCQPWNSPARRPERRQERPFHQRAPTPLAPDLHNINTTNPPTSPNPNRRPRRGITRPRRRIRPEQTRIIRLVRAWECHERAWGPVPAACDTHLRAADVELRAARVLCEVQRDALHTHEVVAAWEGGGEGE